MHFKLTPWDFFSKKESIITTSDSGIFFFQCLDPYFERFLVEYIKSVTSEFKLVFGPEVDPYFVDETIFALTLFSQKENFLIMQADELERSVLVNLVERAKQLGEDFTEQKVVVLFSKKSKSYGDLTKMLAQDKGLKLLGPTLKVKNIQIEEVKFWEGVKLWQLAMQLRKVQYKNEIGQSVLASLEHNLASFLWAIDTIEQEKTILQKDELSALDLRELLKRERWDIFELAQEFNRNPKNFMVELLRREDVDYSFLRSTFAFMQAHILKILYPSEIQAKAKYSKYDEEILQAHRHLSSQDLLTYLKLFIDAEIMAKAQDPFLVDRLRSQIFLL